MKPTSLKTYGMLGSPEDLQLFTDSRDLSYNYNPANLVDRWQTAAQGYGWASTAAYNATANVAYYGYDFGEGRTEKLTAFSMKQYGYPDYLGYNVVKVTLQYSDDKSTWTTQETYGVHPVLWNLVIVRGTVTAHRYWRVMAASNTTTYRWHLLEVEFFINDSLQVNDNTPEITEALPGLVGYVSGFNYSCLGSVVVGGVASVSSYKTYDGKYAFNYDGTNPWVSNGVGNQWLQYDFGLDDSYYLQPYLNVSNVTADSESSSSYPATKILDKTTSSYWQSANTTHPHWVKFEIRPFTYNMSGLLYIASPGSPYLKDFELYGSNDDTTWVLLGTYQYPNSTSNYTFTVDNNVNYKYFKINCLNNWSGSNYAQIDELKWHNNYSVNVTRRLKSLSMYCASGNQTYYPTDFTLVASTTGAFAGEETTLLTVSGISWAAGETKYWNFDNDNYYRYYRLNLTANGGGANYKLQYVWLYDHKLNELTLGTGVIEINNTLYTLSDDVNIIPTVDASCSGKYHWEYIYLKDRKDDSNLTSDDVIISSIAPRWDHVRCGWYHQGGYDQFTLCSGGTVLYGSAYSGYPATNLVDGSLATYWLSNNIGAAIVDTDYIGYDFGAGVTKRIARIRCVAYNLSYWPHEVELQYSDDASTWTKVQRWNNCELSVQSNSVIDLKVNMNNQVTSGHRYWRLLARSASNWNVFQSTDRRWYVAEMEMFEYHPTRSNLRCVGMIEYDTSNNLITFNCNSGWWLYCTNYQPRTTPAYTDAVYNWTLPDFGDILAEFNMYNSTSTPYRGRVWLTPGDDEGALSDVNEANYCKFGEFGGNRDAALYYGFGQRFIGLISAGHSSWKNTQHSTRLNSNTTTNTYIYMSRFMIPNGLGGH